MTSLSLSQIYPTVWEQVSMFNTAENASVFDRFGKISYQTIQAVKSFLINDLAKQAVSPPDPWHAMEQANAIQEINDRRDKTRR